MSNHLRFFFEYGVDTPLWPGAPGDPGLDSPYGYPCDLGRLPISPATRAELARLAHWYQSSLNEAYPPDPSPWPKQQQELFQQQAAAALEALRCELGSDWTVEDRSHPVF
ncbi:hypothetical protein ACFC1R_35705 [Kitasatospora sp. NPDC056138]|uniref:hypothetical protein n=1 Tax=Kitasatospora sp. NPDC056138 TaxID=3345724 RepID=UPI0035DEBA29